LISSRREGDSMGTTKSQSHKRLYWVFVFLVSGLLSALTTTGAQTTETEEVELADNEDEETPVCPGRPLSVRPTEEDMAEFGLSFEALCVIGDTFLGRMNIPGPGESPDLLRRYLRQGPYEFGKMTGAEYRAVMEEAARLWPQSQYAHAGLARALLGEHVAPNIQPTPADKQRAADEFLIATEIAFKEGKKPNDLDYGGTIPRLLAELGDKTALDRYFERVFDLLPPGDTGPWYVSYLQYAQALAKLSDERAETYFQKAIAVRPEGVWEAYEGYVQYLLANQKAQKVLELLAPNSPAQRAVPGDYFHYTRCRALEQVGRKAEASEECQRARELIPPAKRMPAPGGQPGSGPSARGPRAPAEPGLLARLLGISPAQAAHDNPADDCRLNFGYDWYPGDPWNICYYYITWNLAELITNEAAAETYGSRAAVGWTVRDRVLRGGTSKCGAFPGADGTCTSYCPDPQFCELQKKYCCVIHAPNQFNDDHTSVSLENIHLAYDVIDSHTPEPTSGFVPDGASGCTTGVCDSSLQCSQHGDDYKYAEDGPIYFYGNYATSLICQGFQPGVQANWNVVAKETCGDSTDGVGSDNCYGRATRNRKWYAGPDFLGSAGVTTSGNTKQLPVGAWTYRDDNFKNPGGKQVVVQARLETAGQATLRTQLKNNVYQVIYDFGTRNITSTTFAGKSYKSTIVMTPPVSQLIFINEGPGVVILEQMTVRD
jgi:tetratricopeptide (TPR) repeat protein